MKSKTYSKKMEASGENSLPGSDSNRDAVRRALRIQRSTIFMLVPPGQSLVESIVSVFEEEPDRGRGFILSATGSVLNPTIMSRRKTTYTYEGSYMISKLEGSFRCSGDGVISRGKLLVVLTDSDGNEIKGIPVGLLVAVTPIQVHIRYYATRPVLLVRPVSMYSDEFGPSNF